MSHNKPGNPDNDDAFSTLTNNAAAVKAICSAVEGTLGPKGLDTMLVGPGGEVIITNDGVTILEKMDVSHPAARLMIQVAKAQQKHVGDGTTTATVLAGAIVSEGVAQVTRGVPVAKVAGGIQEAARFAISSLKSRSRAIAGMDDPMLYRIGFVAGREQADIAELILEAARSIGPDKLKEDGFRFADLVSGTAQPFSEVWPGIIIRKLPVHLPLSDEPFDSTVLVLQDALEPEAIDEEALMTESGFRTFLQLKEQFLSDMNKLAALGVGFIVCDRGISPDAEQYCSDNGIMVLQRVTRDDLLRAAEYTGAKPVRRSALKKPAGELAYALGSAGWIGYDAKTECVRLKLGGGKMTATIVVGASTSEVVGERIRIAKDAASAVQAAWKIGYLPGGGSVELAVAHELERHRETIQGMEGFGYTAVAQALRKPLAQIVVNAGYNPLEKVEEAKSAQLAGRSDSIGINCDNGHLIDCLEAGIVDSTLVKLHALEAGSEVAAAVLRIHNVIKMKISNDS
jgi:chaperonin GroEL (HSP60 family)